MNQLSHAWVESINHSTKILANVVVQVGHSMKLLTNAITNLSFYEAFDELE
jgi:hypothetical protein